MFPQSSRPMPPPGFTDIRFGLLSPTLSYRVDALLQLAQTIPAALIEGNKFLADLRDDREALMKKHFSMELLNDAIHFLKLPLQQGFAVPIELVAYYFNLVNRAHVKGEGDKKELEKVKAALEATKKDLAEQKSESLSKQAQTDGEGLPEASIQNSDQEQPAEILQLLNQAILTISQEEDKQKVAEAREENEILHVLVSQLEKRAYAARADLQAQKMLTELTLEENAQLKAQIREKDEQLHQAQDQSGFLRRDFSALKDDFKAKEEVMRKYHDSLTKADECLTSYMHENLSLKAEILDKNRKLKAMEESYASAATELEHIQAGVQVTMDSLHQRVLDERKNHAAGLDKEVEKVEKEKQSLLDENEKLIEKMQADEEELRKLKDELKTAQEVSLKYHKESKLMEEEMLQLREEIQRTFQTLRSSEKFREDQRLALQEQLLQTQIALEEERKKTR